MIAMPPIRSTFQVLLPITFILCITAAKLTAQEYGFDLWTTANGLPQNTVTGVAQTPDGYLWLSTFDGLARFDGVRFTVFDKANTKGILNNRFAGILIDREGSLWAITENGIVTICRNGIFSSIQTPETWSGSPGLIEDAHGEAMIETSDGYYYLREGRFVPSTRRDEKNVRHFYLKGSGPTWTVRPNSASAEKDGQIVDYDLALPAEYFGSDFRTPAFEEKRGALWLPFDDKLYRLADGKVAIFTKSEIPALGDQTVQLMLEDAAGALWFIFNPDTRKGSSGGQLVRFKDGQFTSYHLGTYASVTSGIVDREGNFWLASPTGLRRLRQQLITTLSMKDGLNSNEVYPVFERNNGDILIGTVRGVNRYAGGKITDMRLRYSENFPLYMRGLWEDRERRVWLGYQGEGGFGRFDEPSSVKRIGQNDLPNGATDFASDSEGNIWIATENGLFKHKDDREIARYTVNDGLKNDKIIDLHFDRSGALWLGTFDGVSYFRNGSFVNFSDVENSPKGFVRAIYEDADGVLWFGTYGDGLFRYEDGKFFNYRVENGLFNNGVFAILEDRGNLWMSSNRGIHRVSKQDLNDLADGKILRLNSVSFDEKDGMLNAECNGGRIPAAIKTRDGKLWFATMGGVAIVDPEAEKASPKPPPAIIENVSIDRKAVDAEKVRSAANDPDTAIELQPGQSNVAIEYTGMSLVRSGQIKFRCQLEGLEKEPVEAGTRRVADYSYLPPGTYTFRLFAASASGVWNTEGAAIRIVVNPYFYQTWWFRILAALGVALIIAWIYHNRITGLRRIAAAKTMFSRQLIESQEAESKRIASELHDGLGQSLVVIKNRAMLGVRKSDDKDRIIKELESISESATQALDEVREITNNMRPQLLDRLGLTKALISMCKKVEGVVDIECEIADIDGIFSEIEEISLYRIVQESLNNVIKHSNASDARVSISRAVNSVTVEIADNGSGFDTGSVKSGLGLVGLKERAQLLNGGLSIDSRRGEGTKIVLAIKQ